mmetsp:Transcript_16657/g.54245  ORF Transcript_16657/g.54245 Transcript_16657/m.54245 type:complete len:250 (+) Transcript_16657:406-1155(+)
MEEGVFVGLGESRVPLAEAGGVVDAAGPGVWEPEGGPPGEVFELGGGAEVRLEDGVGLLAVEDVVDGCLLDDLVEGVPGLDDAGEVEEAEGPMLHLRRGLLSQRQAVVPAAGVVQVGEFLAEHERHGRLARRPVPGGGGDIDVDHLRDVAYGPFEASGGVALAPPSEVRHEDAGVEDGLVVLELLLAPHDEPSPSPPLVGAALRDQYGRLGVFVEFLSTPLEEVGDVAPHHDVAVQVEDDAVVVEAELR